MKDLKVKTNGNSPAGNAPGMTSPPAYPMLASAYYHFGYLRLARDAGGKK
ncbi:MAG: hypothetical protein ABIM40_04415 [Pseudomonadota bacterium]